MQLKFRKDEGERRERNGLGEFQEERIPRQMVRREEGEIPSS